MCKFVKLNSAKRTVKASAKAKAIILDMTTSYDDDPIGGGFCA